MSPSLFTSESVTEGHPDKVADQISDAVVDAILAGDPAGRVACETLAAARMLVVAGEIGTRAELPDVPALVRDVMKQVGYDSHRYDCVIALNPQSDEIAEGVDQGGAGDQGMMFGFACDDTPELMPAPIAAAHALAKRLAEARKSEEIPWLKPDGKSQVTYEYEGLAPTRIATVVVSTQHADMHGGMKLTEEQIREAVIDKVITPALPERHYDPDSTITHVNPSGSFVHGGPAADAGLTGRKIIVDTYGGMGRHGGGAFSGKDATKVDRSGACAARWAAKNLVAAGAATRCEARLCDRQGRPRSDLGGFVRDRGRSRSGSLPGRGVRLRLHAPGHHRCTGAHGSGLPPHRRLWTLRAHSPYGDSERAPGAALRLGANRSGG